MARPRDPEVDTRIVQAARELLAEGGHYAVTVTAAAERAGVSRPTVYRRYRDTRDLLMAVLFEDLEAGWAEIRANPPATTDPLEHMARVARHFFDYYARNPVASRAMLQSALFAEAPWDEAFAAQGMGFVAWMAQQLEGCRGPGGLAPHADTGLLAQAWFGIYLTLAMAGVNGARMPPDVQEMLLRAVLGQHLRGCLA
ncbi:MAG: TetR/AcrR family transcriptional regulator [Alphaproteobacteria bacterium]|nr:TetR/AcrR family transcriptional regulator [Alphaproteobacteria bacterium]